MKHFLGKAQLNHDRGISSYSLCHHPITGERYAMLQGTFTREELQSLVDALNLKNDSFEFPETVKNS
jgi:hypothetical protein